MMQSNISRPKLKRHAQQGLTLIEMVLQLSILVVVSLPMLMTLNLQKQLLEVEEYNLRNQASVGTLFDEVDPNRADWFSAYNRTTKTSINGSGEPYYKRIMSITDDSNVKVTVNLYKKPNDNSEVPYYTSSREYEITAFRVNMNETAIDADQEDNLWYPDLSSTISGDNWTFIKLSGPCSGNPTFADYPASGTLSIPAPYKGAILMRKANSTDYCDASTTAGGGISYKFRVKPAMKYDVIAHVILPQGIVPDTKCLLGADTLTSCQLVDIEVSFNNNGTVSLVTEKENLDINMAGGPDINGSNLAANTSRHKTVAIRVPVQIPTDPSASVPNKNDVQLIVSVRPSLRTATGTGVGTSTVYLAGLEVVQRGDL